VKSAPRIEVRSPATVAALARHVTSRGARRRGYHPEFAHWQHNCRVAVVVTDPNGVQWNLKRKWWPFGDMGDWADIDFFGWFALLIAAPFLLVWPFWLATKFLGLQRWRIVIERAHAEVGDELVRGWSASGRRLNDLALEIGQGSRSGHFTL
jgi:hypothetical protein